MRKSNLLFYLWLFVLCANITNCIGQTTVLHLDELKSILLQFHPVAKQGKILVEKSNNEVMAARGSFDPALQYSQEQKSFKGQTYYTYNNAALKIPTWYGITITAGTDVSEGYYINPEFTSGTVGYTGIQIPLAKNLLLDQRRAGLQQAKLFVQQSEQEQKLMLNNLFYDAYQSYFQWLRDYINFDLYNTIYNNNKERHSFVVRSFNLGDKPAVDTVESLAQLQQMEALRNEAQLKWLQSGYLLSNYLWTQQNEPYVLSINIIPDTTLLYNPLTQFDSLDAYLSSARSHPKLNIYNSKLNILQVEKKLKQQYLLPQLDLNLYKLQSDQVIANPFSDYTQGNFKAGLNFSYYLFQRNSRAQYRNAKLKIQETNFDLSYTRNEIESKVKQYYTERNICMQQNKLYRDIFNNASKLFDAERIKYEVGESQLFVVNSRENKLLEFRLKWIENLYKIQKANYSLMHATGMLYAQ